MTDLIPAMTEPTGATIFHILAEKFTYRDKFHKLLMSCVSQNSRFLIKILQFGTKL